MDNCVCFLVMSGDLSFGNLTFAMGSSINDVECAHVEVIEDDMLESEEDFFIYVSNTLTQVKSDDSATEMVNADLIFTTITFPCENTSIIIDISNTDG